MANNILGIDLNVNQDVLEEAVKNTVMASIASAMDTDKVIEAIVHSVLTTKVDKNGKVSSWASDNKYTLLEYYVRNSVKEAASEYTKQLIEERMPRIKQAVRAELDKPATTDSMVEAFIKSFEESLQSRWRSTVKVTFGPEED